VVKVASVRKLFSSSLRVGLKNLSRYLRVWPVTFPNSEEKGGDS
jgi:hypothetical protein